MANAKENVLLQGYPKTGVLAKAEQFIVTQGYDNEVPIPGAGAGNDIVGHHHHHGYTGRTGQGLVGTHHRGRLKPCKAT